MTKRRLTTQEVAENLGVTPRRVQKLLSEGRVTCAQFFAGRWVIREDFKILPSPKRQRVPRGAG